MKKWIIMLVLILSFTMLTGWRIGYDPHEEWNKEWYGWYLILDATGDYEDLKKQREDGIAVIDLPDTYHGDDHGTITIYDRFHSQTPMMVLNAYFEKQKTTIQEGGMLAGLEVTKLDYILQAGETLELENILYGEGTIGNEKGTVTLQMLFLPAEEENGWKTLQENKGKLPISDEELLPEYYEEFFLPISKMDGYSVNAYFSSFEPLAEDVIKADFARNVELDGEVRFFRLDQSSEVSQIAIWSETDVYEFQLFEKSSQKDAGLKSLRQGRALDLEARYVSLEPKVYQFPFCEENAEYEIRFQDIRGREYSYHLVIDESNKTLSLKLESGETNSEKDKEVADTFEAYDTVIKSLLQEVSRKEFNEENIGIFEIAAYNSDPLNTLGYLVADVTGDGEENLIIARKNDTGEGYRNILQVYTRDKNGEAERLFNAWDRKSLNMLAGGFWLNEGSNGVGRSEINVYRPDFELAWSRYQNGNVSESI